RQWNVFLCFQSTQFNQNLTLWEKMGQSAEIHCSHTKGGSYFQMYWYRQLPGETMKQIVYTTTSSKEFFGGFKEEKYSITRPNAESGTFTVKNLEPEDTGWYFCAVSEHSDTDTCES
uniref:Ig-like domain-containing protein n=1 Tax=Echeneis naucrates TaxID=173247 RepID=A0A665W599_ECHNA